MNKLTEREIKVVEKYKNEWLKVACCTDEADRDRAEAAITTMYELIGEKRPKFEWYPSSVSCKTAVVNLDNYNWTNVRAMIARKFKGIAKNLCGYYYYEYLHYEKKRLIKNGIIDNIQKNSGYYILCSLWKPYSSLLGQHDSYWIAYIHAIVTLKLKSETYNLYKAHLKKNKVNHLKLWGEIARSCGPWWPFKNICIITDRPQTLVFNENHNLHNTVGPAAVFRDGIKIYALDGVKIAGQLIEDPDSIDPASILRMQNQEEKRRIIEVYGWERLLSQLEVKTIQSDRYGTLIEVPGSLRDADNNARFVKVRCPTKDEEYTLRVPPNIRTAHDGVAWTFAEETRAYRPLVET